MSGICIEKLSHTCGTKKGLQVFADYETGEVSGYCFSCGEYIPNPYGDKVNSKDLPKPKKKTKAEIYEEIAEVDSYPTVDLPSRKLRGKYLKQFGIKTSLSEYDGKTPTATYFPIRKGGVLTGYYIKTLTTPSHQWAIGDVKGAEPIGWQEAKRSGAYKLIITEGREDAVAVASIFDRFSTEDYMPAIIALPNGVKSVSSSLSQIADEANQLFKEIVLVFDMDEAGKEAVKEAMFIFPDALTVVLPEKDPNDCIIKGASKAAYKAMAFGGKSPKNTRLVRSGPELHAKARIPTPFGEITWPYPKMNDLMRGIRYGETIYIGAGVKMGKSQLIHNLLAHFIQNHGVKCFIAAPEEQINDTYKGIAGKIVGRIFNDPKIEFDYEAYDKAGDVIKDKLMFVNMYQYLGWETLKKDMISAANEGFKVFCIDPITNLTAGMSPAEANTMLEGVSRDLASLAKDLNVVVFITVHLKAPEGNISKDQREKFYSKGQYHQLGNCSHERGGTIYSNQFTGSRAMMRACNLMLALEGNKDPELPDEIRSMRWLTILEDRGFGNSESIPLYYNENTQVYKEA